MALSIKSPDAERLARQVAELTGEGITEAIMNALTERLQRLEQQKTRPISEQLDEIARRCAALPDVDRRTADEIIGYDEHGLPR
jgi:antitoxin VapB